MRFVFSVRCLLCLSFVRSASLFTQSRLLSLLLFCSVLFCLCIVHSLSGRVWVGAQIRIIVVFSLSVSLV